MVYSTGRSKAVVPVFLTLCCFVVYSTRRFVLCLTLCYYVLVFFSPFSIAITSLGQERANLSLVLSCYGYPDLIVPHAVKLTVFPRPLAGEQGQYVEIKYVVYLTL